MKGKLNLRNISQKQRKKKITGEIREILNKVIFRVFYFGKELYTNKSRTYMHTMFKKNTN